ncbi:MAG TPA: cation transporter [Candidatus Paceibacterota bacterium]|nr:cation transporter [Candidatus Paceibacterota bacterium]
MLTFSRAFIKKHPIATYLLVWVLSVFIVALELVGSGVSGSQALLADVGHVASDTLLALVPVAALVFVRAGLRYDREAFFGSLAAALLLFFVGFHVGGEALEALRGDEHHEHEVDGMLLFIFSGVAAIANLFQHRLLSRIDPEHHHGAHKGLHFHVLMDLVKNIALPLLGILIALSILPDHADLWAALIIAALLIVRGALLLYAMFFAPDTSHKDHDHA